MTDLRVFGIGSPFGDDQLGWAVINKLQQQASLHHYSPHRLQMACCDRPGMHLLELMRHAKTVFLIDAVKAGTTIGTLHCFTNDAIENRGNTLSTHGLGIAEAMTMGAALGELPEHVILYGIDIGDIHDVDIDQVALSETITQAVKALSVRIENDILSVLR